MDKVSIRENFISILSSRQLNEIFKKIPMTNRLYGENYFFVFNHTIIDQYFTSVRKLTNTG